MAHAEQSITINRPVNVVYDFILDGANNTKWRPGVADIQQLPGKPLGVGAVFKQGMKGPGGRRIAADYELIECRPNEFIKFQVIAGPARPTGTYQFEPGGDGPKVTFTHDFQPNEPAILMG